METMTGNAQLCDIINHLIDLNLLFARPTGAIYIFVCLPNKCTDKIFKAVPAATIQSI